MLGRSLVCRKVFPIAAPEMVSKKDGVMTTGSSSSAEDVPLGMDGCLWHGFCRRAEGLFLKKPTLALVASSGFKTRTAVSPCAESTAPQNHDAL